MPNADATLDASCLNVVGMKRMPKKSRLNSSKEMLASPASTLKLSQWAGRCHIGTVGAENPRFLPCGAEVLSNGGVPRCKQAGALVVEYRQAQATGPLFSVRLIEERGCGNGGWNFGGGRGLSGEQAAAACLAMSSMCFIRVQCAM